MSGYNFNLYNGDGIPDQGSNGLPLVIADANLPTQAVSASPVEYSTPLHYSPHMVESGLRTPATTHRERAAVVYSRVAATGAPSKQKFEPTPQPEKPPLWRSIVNAVVGGKIKTGSAYAAQNNYSAQGGGTGVSGVSSATPTTGGATMSQTGGSGGMVTPGGARTA